MVATPIFLERAGWSTVINFTTPQNEAEEMAPCPLGETLPRETLPVPGTCSHFWMFLRPLHWCHATSSLGVFSLGRKKTTATTAVQWEGAEPARQHSPPLNGSFLRRSPKKNNVSDAKKARVSRNRPDKKPSGWMIPRRVKARPVCGGLFYVDTDQQEEGPPKRREERARWTEARRPVLAKNHTANQTHAAPNHILPRPPR